MPSPYNDGEHIDGNLTVTGVLTTATGLRAPTAMDVATFGAKGDGVTDDTNAVQAAINSFPAGTTGTVTFPPGTFVLSQLVVPPGVSLVGAGVGSTGSIGTMLQQKAGTDLDLIVSSLSGNVYHHWSRFSHFQMNGLGHSTATASSGIHIGVATGEGFKIEHVIVNNFAYNGIQLDGVGPCYLEDIHSFGNGWGAAGAGVSGYGICINATATEIMSMTKLSMISGDDNQIALIGILGSAGYSSKASWIIEGVKAEVNVSGKQPYCIHLDSFNASTISIHGVSFTSNGLGATSVIHMTNLAASPQILWSAIASAGVTNFLDWGSFTIPPASTDNSSHGCYYQGGTGTFYARYVLAGEDPPQQGSMVGLGLTNGVGNTTLTSLQAPAKGTGSGPVSLTAAGFVRLMLNGSYYWVPYFA